MGELEAPMNRLKQVVLLVGLLVLSGGLWASARQASQGVLDPEDANEARLNRLQMPGRTMDAIGLVAGMSVAEMG